MIIISIVYLVWNFIKFKEIDWLISFFTLLISANIFTLIVGAPFESQRLFFSSIVPVLLLISYTIKNIKKGVNKGEKKLAV